MGKRAYLLKFIQDIRASYWFLPSLLVGFGLLLAGATEWLDRNTGILPVNLPETFLDTKADGARATLAVIAQSIIGVTGVMFSMTIVAVSFASGNFGPRLIGNFMRDRGNQWSLGILIATFVYTLIILRSVQDEVAGGVDPFVPQYSLLVALALTLLCVFTMIYFVHHVPETINVSRISANLANRLQIQIRALIDAPDQDTTHQTWPTDPPRLDIRATSCGYIQTCNLDQLAELAKQHDWFLEMRPAIGDFITTETKVFAVWSASELTEDQQQELLACFAVGTERTENQNPAFLAHQLVEMIARALSPGVNDPYTAIDCLNRLHAALIVASTYKNGLQSKPVARIRHPQLSFERLFGATFPLCRQYIRPDDLTRDHALGLLNDVHAVARADDKPIIAKEIDALSRANGTK